MSYAYCFHTDDIAAAVAAYAARRKREMLAGGMTEGEAARQAAVESCCIQQFLISREAVLVLTYEGQRELRDQVVNHGPEYP